MGTIFLLKKLQGFNKAHCNLVGPDLSGKGVVVVSAEIVSNFGTYCKEKTWKLFNILVQDLGQICHIDRR